MIIESWECPLRDIVTPLGTILIDPELFKVVMVVENLLCCPDYGTSQFDAVDCFRVENFLCIYHILIFEEFVSV